MTAKLAPMYYGMKEISALHHRYTYMALTVAVILHFIAVGLYYTFSLLMPQEIKGDFPWKPPTDWVFITPIDPENNFGQLPRISPTKPKADFGTPVPVPPWELKEEPTFADPKDVSPYTGSTGGSTDGNVGQPTGTGDIPGIPDDQPIDLTTNFKETVKIPAVVRQVKPEYPEDARRLGMEATVVVKLLIDKEGKPKRAVIFNSQNELFNEKAMQAAMQWLFTPAIMNGQIISVWVTVPFRFRLNH